MDYHLAHARAAASGATPGARASVKESVEGLSRTLMRLHAGHGVAIDAQVAPEHSVRAQREDLDEMLGNLLDNGCKWAKSRVVVESATHESDIVITVDDDGPGLDPSMRDVVLQRGVRADEAAPGSGLGLAIVRDLAELYGGSISLSRSPADGVRARLQLPSADGLSIFPTVSMSVKAPSSSIATSPAAVALARTTGFAPATRSAARKSLNSERSSSRG